MQPTLEQTIAFAALQHEGQTDKAGSPYILHPLRVLNNLGHGATLSEQLAAVLHDVVEDCAVTLGELRRMGYAAEVIEAVDALTKRPEEVADYEAAIRPLAGNPIARRVKIADLTDNLDLRRIAELSKKDRARLVKYEWARNYLCQLESATI